MQLYFNSFLEGTNPTLLKKNNRQHSDSNKNADINKVPVLLVDNIFVIFGECLFQQTVGVPMYTNCVSLLPDYFLYSYEADIMQGFFKKTNEPVISFMFMCILIFFLY